MSHNVERWLMRAAEAAALMQINNLIRQKTNIVEQRVGGMSELSHEVQHALL